MASNGIDVWIPPKVKWDKKRTVIFALLGSLVAFCALKQVFVDNLIVTSIMFLSVLLAILRTFPSKWFRFLAAFSILTAFIGFEQGSVDALIVGDFIFLLVLLTIAYTFPDKLHRFLTALSIVIVLSIFLGVNIYDFASSKLDIIMENRVLKLFFEGQAERAIFSGLAGLIGGLLTVGALLLLFTFPSSEFILALHEFAGVKRADALRWLWSLIMGIQHPWQVVEDGKVTVTKPKGVFGEIGGPGVVVIRPGNAVIFERGGELTRIEGPGVYKTKRFERIKEVVDLRPQWSTIKTENMLTKDRVPLMFEAGVGYQIEPKQDTDRRIEKAESKGKEFKWEYEKGNEVIEGIYPVYKDSVFRAVYRVSRAGWRLIMQAVADSFLRDVVIAYTLDQLYELPEAEEGELKEELRESPRIIAEIEDQVKKKLEKAAIGIGVRIGTFDIKSVTMPEEVRERVLQWWEAEWKRKIAVKEAKGERQAMIEKAMGKAWALERLEGVKADARRRMIRQLVNAIEGVDKISDGKTTIRFIHVIEQLSRRMMTDDIIASHYMEVLEAIAESGGQKVFILGEDRRLLERGEDTLRGLLEAGVLKALEPPSEGGSDGTGGPDAQSPAKE